MPIRTSDLDYELPPGLIAQRPCEPRDGARLMVVHRASGLIEHRTFRDLPEYLQPNDCLVVNATKVIPARFEARRATGGRIEGLFIEEREPGLWRAMLTGIGKLKEGEAIGLGDAPWKLIFLRRLERGECELRVEPTASAMTVLEQVGLTPLPPYIHRDNASQDAGDRTSYQTMFARQPGAVAAPTAGLHFTPRLLDAVRAAGVSMAEVVLHVGLGTFQPIEVDDLAEHRMHKEWFEMTPAAADAIHKAREAKGRTIAVGTTSVRVLETCARGGELTPQTGWTDIFIYPPYQFRAVDALVTNFHLPGSTLLALVSAFAGFELVRKAYRTAIAERYRFFSYGDAMVIF